MSSMLKATNALKSRQVTNAVREFLASSLYRLTASASTSVVGDRCNLYYDAEAPSFNASYFTPRSSANPISTLIGASGDPPGFPPSPTSENTGSSNGLIVKSKVTCFELPFFPFDTRPTVGTGIDQNYGICIHPWQQFYFDYGVTGIPKTNLRPFVPDEERFYLSKGFGEDACFIRRDSLGVADGVGGWKKIKGASSAFFSRNLMHFACEELIKIEKLCNSTHPTSDNGTRFIPPSEGGYAYAHVDPVKILETSYRLASESAALYKVKGSSTACIVILRNKELRIANLGDCGVAVLRGGSIIFQTSEQQHSFNFPYQLGTNSKDRPTDAQSYFVPVQRGDVLVMGSDGLFDNLFGSDIEEEVSKWIPTWDWESMPSLPGEVLSLSTMSTTVHHQHPICDASLCPGDLSHALASRACYVSQQTSSDQSTPFKERAKKEGVAFKGGKRDDITVLVAVVAPSFSKPDL